MTDNLTPEDRRKTMRAVKGKRTSLERRLFSMLAGMGLSGWRQNADDIIGKPDVVFDSRRIAIFVDGCFWHGCRECERKLPQSNRDYWTRKIQRNVERAQAYNQTLTENGWMVIRIWEHQFRNSLSRQQIRDCIRSAIKATQTPNE